MDQPAATARPRACSDRDVDGERSCQQSMYSGPAGLRSFAGQGFQTGAHSIGRGQNVVDARDGGNASRTAFRRRYSLHFHLIFGLRRLNRTPAGDPAQQRQVRHALRLQGPPRWCRIKHKGPTSTRPSTASPSPILRRPPISSLPTWSAIGCVLAAGGEYVERPRGTCRLDRSDRHDLMADRADARELHGRR